MEMLRQLRTEKRLTQKDVADYLGISQQCYANYENGKREPGFKMLEKIVNYYGICYDEVFGRQKYAEEYFTPEISMLPILGNAAAGRNVIAQDNIEGYFAVMNSSIRNPEECFCLNIRGDSMKPLIDTGDTVVVRRQSSIESGTIAIVRIDDEEGVVKKVVYTDTYIKLVSLNEEYEPRIFVGHDILRVQIVGRVLQVIKNL